MYPIYTEKEMTDTGDHASEIATQGSIAIIEQVCQNNVRPVESLPITTLNNGPVSLRPQLLHR